MLNTIWLDKILKMNQWKIVIQNLRKFQCCDNLGCFGLFPHKKWKCLRRNKLKSVITRNGISYRWSVMSPLIFRISPIRARWQTHFIIVWIDFLRMRFLFYSFAIAYNQFVSCPLFLFQFNRQTVLLFAFYIYNLSYYIELKFIFAYITCNVGYFWFSIADCPLKFYQ